MKSSWIFHSWGQRLVVPQRSNSQRRHRRDMSPARFFASREHHICRNSLDIISITYIQCIIYIYMYIHIYYIFIWYDVMYIIYNIHKYVHIQNVLFSSRFFVGKSMGFFVDSYWGNQLDGLFWRLVNWKITMLKTVKHHVYHLFLAICP
jgi:hypothetical protein